MRPFAVLAAAVALAACSGSREGGATATHEIAVEPLGVTVSAPSGWKIEARPGNEVAISGGAAGELVTLWPIDPGVTTLAAAKALAGAPVDVARELPTGSFYLEYPGWVMVAQRGDGGIGCKAAWQKGAPEIVKRVCASMRSTH